jgi:methionine-rich copper-binding protein CopC
MQGSAGAVLVLALSVMVGVAPSPASAHAFLDRASPGAGAVLPAAPAEVALRFTEPLEAAFSTAEVTDRDGHRVDHGPAVIAAAEPSVLRVPLSALPPGAYRVRWRAVCADGHVTTGSFSFAIASP